VLAAQAGLCAVGCPRGRAARVSSAAVDRDTVLWTLVLFFGASLMFATIRDATRGEGIGVALVAQVAAGLLLVAGIVLYVRRKR
jgi:hypothetical protein